MIASSPFRSGCRELESHCKDIKNKHLKDMFAKQPNRGEKFSISTEHIYYDYSRQRVTEKTIQLLQKLSHQQKLGSKISGLFNGDKINATEGRSVLHTALRNKSGISVLKDGIDVTSEVKEELSRLKTFANQVHSGQLTGITGKTFKNIVSIGIGGSFLGPEFLAVACKPFAREETKLLFISNIDGQDFIEKTRDIDPEETLIIVVSKTFTTAETLQNARTAKQWLLNRLNNDKRAIATHFVAVTSNKEKANEFGISELNIFRMWDWVGGRFSSSSMVGGAPLALYLGYERFNQILDGAYWMDQHFRTAPFHQNIPVMSGLLDIWNINIMKFKTRALLPYSQNLSHLALHTQQVEMESNGKSVDKFENFVNFDTGEVVFGQAGTNGQHSFYQLLHQGTQIVPCDFIGFIHPPQILDNGLDKVTHHEELMTNFFAQPDALAFGQKDEKSYKTFEGNRPSSIVLFKKLTPFTAGILLAYTEHRTAVKGFLWDINSFDQFGVELGKKLGKEHRNRIIKFNEDEEIDDQGLNNSTKILLKAFLRKELPNGNTE